MLTPSLNQDSLIPTFNGPLAGVSVKVLTNLVDALEHQVLQIRLLSIQWVSTR